MAIARDSSSPGAILNSYVAGTFTYTSPAFSPPANSLLIFSIPTPTGYISGSPGFVFNTPTNTGTALTWNLLTIQQDPSYTIGGVAVFWAYNTAAQTGITCTATVSTSSGYTTPTACLEVWTGTKGNFTGAALVTGSTTAGPGNVAITTTAAGSQVAGIYLADFPSAYPPSSTDVAEAVWGAAYGYAGLCAYKSAPVASAGATYLNFTDATTSGETNEYIVYEILAATGGSDTGGETICYFEDDVDGYFEAPDIAGLDNSIFDFYGNAEPLPPDTVMAATQVELGEAFEYEDPSLDVDGEDFYWATGPPLPDDSGQTTSYYPDQDIDDPEPESYGTFGSFQRPADVVGSQILGGTFPDDDPDADADEVDTGTRFEYQIPPDDTGGWVIYWPDEVEEPEEEAFGFESFPIGTEAGPDSGGESICYTPDDTAEDDDVEALEAASHSDFQIPGDDTGQTIICLPDEAEELDDEPAQQNGGIVGSETAPDPGGEAIVYCPDQDLDDPEPETYGTFAKWQPPADDTGVSAIYFPDEPEEPDDEQFGSEGFLVGTEGIITTPYIPGAEAYPAEAEEPEDEDFGFASLFQLPSDDTGQTIVYEPDEAEEPEDEPFDWADAPRPADFVAPQPLTLWQFPDEAEEPEDEPFDFALAPLALDDAGQTRALLEDEPEEPDDEDYGLSSFLLPPDALPNAPTCYYPDEAEEPEDEPYGMHDLQIPQNATSDCPPQNTWHEPARVRNFQEPARRRVWHIGRI